MKTVTVSITYNVKHWVNDSHVLTECGRIINVKRGAECRQFLRGSQPAVYMNGIVYLIEDLKVFVKTIDCPF